MPQNDTYGRRRRIIRGADDPVTMIDELTAAGFTGPRFEQLWDDLWEYGFDVLRGLVRTGKIVGVRTGRPNPQLRSEDRRTLHDSWEREGLVLDALIVAVPKFIGYLREGRWSPAGGASLGTYFTGTCAKCFWPVYDRWSTDRLRLMKALGQLDDRPPDDDLEEITLRLSQRDAVQRVLREATPEVRAICAGILHGKTYGEIGDELGLTARGVEGRLYQLRRKAWRLVKCGSIDPGLIPGSRVALARQGAIRRTAR